MYSTPGLARAFRRATANASRFEFGKASRQAPRVKNQPSDQAGEHQSDDRIRRPLVALAGVAALVTIGLSTAAMMTVGEFSIAAVHSRTSEEHPNVRHVTSGRLSDILKSASEDMVLFDVREPDEYAVSRIPGAVRVDPSLSSAAFIRRFGPEIKGRKVVFYCSVGVRSTRLADRMQADLARLGAKQVVNLRGGLFGWHNETRPLVDEAGSTEWIHPFNEFWAQFVRRYKWISYEPRPVGDG